MREVRLKLGKIRVGGALIEGVGGADLDALPNGSPAEVLFRPESLSIAGMLAPAAAAEASAAAEPAAGGDSMMRNRLEVTVLLCTFEGSRWRSAVETGDGQKLYVLSESPLSAGSRQLARLPETGAFLYAPA
ncbi:TOBE domain-containing protein [Paenibacillus cymbidii]|uniref:TOBE domain-containing protein n=1 Tax=Paenibacillus cymbidii TaxID=1639034 RepID=UPI001F28724C|nr:TOBE domain-containing protein [Paenibacillus cymbidii]